MILELKYNNFDFSKYKTNDMNLVFVYLCRDNYLDIAKWLYEYKQRFNDKKKKKHWYSYLCKKKINIPDNDEIYTDAFQYACTNGNIDIAKWLLEIRPNIKTSNINHIFNLTSISGQLSVLKWLLSIFDNINISYNNEIIFRNVCNEGNLQIAKWLYSIKPDIDISVHDEIIFRTICASNFLNMVIWLLRIKPDINISIYDELPFISACLNNHLRLAKCLLSIKPTIDVNINNDYIFQNVCEKGHLNVIKWLISLNRNINIYANGDRAFYSACRNNHIMVVKFLRFLKPSYFFFTLNYNKIASYYVFKRLNISTTVKRMNEIKMCNICYGNSNVITKCNHTFCCNCINNWFTIKNTCPCCRRIIDIIYFIV